MESCHSVSTFVTKVPSPCHRLLPNKIYSTLGHLISILEQLNTTEDFRVVIQRILTEQAQGDDLCPANSQTSLARRLDPDTLVKVFEILGKVNSSIVTMAMENDGTKSNSSAAPKSSMLESLGIKHELELALKAMDEKNLSLTQDNMYLVKKLKEFEQKHKPLQEKNRKFLEKNMELTTALRNLKDENNNNVEENQKLKEQLDCCRRKSSQLTRQLNQEKLEKATLEVKVTEMEGLRQQISEHDKTITSLKQICAEKDRRVEILQHRKKRRLRMSVEQLARVNSPNNITDDDRSLDSSLSSVTSGGTLSDDDLLEEPFREETEKNYKQLMKEHLLMEKSMAQLHGSLGCRTDPQRYQKVKADLETALFIAQCRIENLETAVQQQQGIDCSWVTEKDQLCSENQSLRKQLAATLRALEEAQEQTENLEFLVLESQEGLEKSKSPVRCDVSTATDDVCSSTTPEEDVHTQCDSRVQELSREISELRSSEEGLQLQLDMAEKVKQDYRGHIEGLEEKLSRLLEGKGPEGESVITQLKSAEKHVVDLEGTMQEVQSKVINLQKEKSDLSEKLSKYKDKSEAQERSLALTRDERGELLQIKRKTPDKLLVDRLKLAERGGPETKERNPKFVHVDFGENSMLTDRSLSPSIGTLRSQYEADDMLGLGSLDDVDSCSAVRKEDDQMLSCEAADMVSNGNCSILSDSFLHMNVIQEVDRLQNQVAELQDENDVLRYELSQKLETGSSSGSEAEDGQVAELREICESLRERAHSAELSERQLRDRLKLAERTINELEASEASLRDKMEEAVNDCDKLKKQIVRLQKKIRDLKEMQTEKEVSEQSLTEKVEFLGEAEIINSRRINELEETNQVLRQRLEIKEELLSDVHLAETLKEKVTVLEEENNELNAKINELEEDAEVLRDNWKKVADEEANRCECLEDKIKSLKNANKDLKSRLKEKESDLDLSMGPSLAAEIDSRTIEQLRERIAELEDELQTISEQKNSKIESLQESVDNLKQNEIKLSETVAEMEVSESQLKDKIAVMEQSENSQKAVSTMLSYEGKLSEMQGSQENLLERLDSLEDHEDALKQRLHDMEQSYEKKIQSLKFEISNLQTKEVELTAALETFESKEKQLQDRIEELENIETSLTVRFSQRVEELENNQSSLTENFTSKIEELEKVELELQEEIFTLEAQKFELSSRLHKVKEENEDLVCNIQELELKIEDLENHENEISKTFSNQIQELEKHEEELMEKVRILESETSDHSETPASQENSQFHQSPMTDGQVKIEVANKMESYAKLEKQSEEKLKMEPFFDNDIDSIRAENAECKKQLEELKGRLDEQEQLKKELLQKYEESENEQRLLAEKLKKQEKKKKKAQRSDNLDDYDSLAREMVTYKVEVDQLRTENTDLHERLMELDESEKQFQDRTHDLETELQIMTEKLTVIQDAEGKFMDRISELEDIECSLRQQLEQHQTTSGQNNVHQTVENSYESEQSENSKDESSEDKNKNFEKELEKLQEKLSVFQDAESKFMDRIGELEEIEQSLRQQLQSQKTLSIKDIEQVSIDSEESKSAVETLDKLVGTDDFMEGVMGHTSEGSTGKPVSSMFERIQGLEAENQTLQTKLSTLTATDTQVRQLTDKVRQLEETEDSLMERVLELEDQEDQLKMELNKLRRSSSAVPDLEEDLAELQDRETDLKQTIETLEREKCTLKKSYGLSDTEKNDFAVRLTSLQILYDEEKKKVDSLLKGEERLMKSLSSEKRAVKEFELELSNTQEKLEEIQTEYEHKLSECEESEKRIKEELNRQMREKEMFRKKLQEFEKSNSELEDEIEACKISESRMFHRHQQLITQNQELEQMIQKLRTLLPDNHGNKATDQSSGEKKPVERTLSMSDNPDLISENPLTKSVFSENELKLLRGNSERDGADLLGAVPLDMLRKMREFDSREMSYQAKIDELENKNVKLVRKLKVLQSKDKDLKSEIKEMQMELLKYRESSSSLRASTSSLDLDKSLSDDGTDSDNQLSNTQETNSSSMFEAGNSNLKHYEYCSRDQLLLTVKLFEKKQTQDAERIKQLESQSSASHDAIQEAIDVVQEDTFDSFMDRVNTFQNRATSQAMLEEGIFEDVMTILESQISLRQRFEALQSSEEALRLALAESEIQLENLHKESVEKVSQLEAQIHILAKLGDKYQPTAGETASLVSTSAGETTETEHTTPQIDDQHPLPVAEDTLWQKLELSSFRVTSPERSLLLETTKTINIDVPPATQQNDVCYLGQSETIKVNVPPTHEFLEQQIERERDSKENEQDLNMMDKPEDVLRLRIRELEKLEKHLKQQLYDLETDRDELHDIARKDKNIIHDQNVRIRELQLREINLQEQLKNFELNENALYSRIDELENENLHQGDRIRDLEILEGRLKDLVNKYKLDGKILETNSKTLASSMQELSAKEENLKQKLHNLETEKSAFSERSEYLQRKVKELESAESDITQRTMTQENLTQLLQGRVAELEMFGFNAQQRIIELETINLELTQRMHLAMTENSRITQHASDLENRAFDLEADLREKRRSSSQSRHDDQETDGGQQQTTVPEVKFKEVEMQPKIRQLEESETMLKDRASKLQRNENTLKYRVQELENAGLQVPGDLEASTSSGSNKLPRNLEDCQRRIISLQNSNAELLSRIQQYQTVSGTRAMVQLPQAEYQQLQVKAGLLDQTEAQMEQTERQNANLQTTVAQLREGKDVCGHEVELDVLRKRLEQSQKSVQMLRNPGSRQWNQNGQNVKQPVQGYSGGDVIHGVMSPRTLDLFEDQVHVTPGDKEWLSLPRGVPHPSGEGEVEETIRQNQTGTVQSRPTGHLMSRDHMLTDLMRGLDAPGQPAGEDRHWRDIESYAPEVGSRDEQWINVGKATSLHAANPQWSHRNDEELELGINLSSENESQLVSQNDTDSDRYAQRMRQMNKPVLNGSTHAPNSRSPPLHNNVQPSRSMKVTDSFVESLSMPGSVIDIDSVDEIMLDPSQEVLLRTGGRGRGLLNTLPPASALSAVESVADSGRGTASVSMATSGMTLRERIAHIEKQLSTRESDSGRDFHDTEPTTWKARVLESNRKLELTEKENKHIKDEINRLEKEVEEKSRLCLVLESFLTVVEKILQEKNMRNEEELIAEVETEATKTRTALENIDHRPSDISNDPAALNTEMARKDRELAAKRSEVDILMRELRQWQEECRTIEEMRSNALDSLRWFEVEISELQNADKQLKEMKDHYNTLRGQFMRLMKAYKISELVQKKLEEVTVEKDDLDIEAAGLRSKVMLLEGQINVFEEVVQEKTDLVKQVSELKFKVKDFEKLEADYSTLEEKLLKTTDALNERMRKVEELTEEIFVLRKKTSHLEKDNYSLRQSITKSNGVKFRVDDVEQSRSKLHANVAPLRTKIVRLTQLCNEKDAMIKKLVQELKSGARHSPLVEELFRLENKEDMNHNHLRRSSSQSSLGSGDHTMYFSDSDVLQELSPRRTPRPRSADLYSRRPSIYRHGHMPSHLPHRHRNSLPNMSPEFTHDTNGIAECSDFVAIADYDPSMFLRSGRQRLELSLKEGDVVTVTGPLDENGYYEAEVNGQVGLVPSNYVQPLLTSPRTGRGKGMTGHLDESPEKIAEMYHHLNSAHQTNLHVPMATQGKESREILKEIAMIENIELCNSTTDNYPNNSNLDNSKQTTTVGEKKYGNTRLPNVNGVASGNTRIPSYQTGPPAAPSNFHVDKIIGNSSLMLSWQPLALDNRGCSNGVKVNGFRVYKDSKVLFHPTSSQQTKAVVENIDIHAHHRFGIQTVSTDGQVSELSEIMYEGVEEVTSDENSDTESEMDMSGVIDVEEYKNGPKRLFMGVYDYDPNKNSPQDHPSSELSFKAGDVITVYGRQRADGFYHGEINGNRGLVPAFFIEEVPQAPPRTKKNSTKTKSSKDSKATEKQKSR